MPLLSPPFYEACLLSSETIRFDDERIDWAPAVGGILHSALCPSCTAKTSSAGELRLRSPLASDIAQSLDGFYVVSPSAQAELMGIGVSAFHPISESEYGVIIVADLPTIELDGEASGLRDSEICERCGEVRETLYGINTSTRPPQPMKLIYDEPRFPIGRTNCRFGAGFRRVEKLFISDDALARIRTKGLTGADPIKWG